MTDIERIVLENQFAIMQFLRLLNDDNNKYMRKYLREREKETFDVLIAHKHKKEGNTNG